MVLAVQRLQVIESLEDGVNALATPLFDSPDGTVGLH
jgi:hypothetical protein